MNFQAITMTYDSAGPVFTHTSEEVYEQTRDLITPLLGLDQVPAREFSLPPHWTISWESEGEDALVTFTWRKRITVAVMVLAYSNKGFVEAEFRDHPAYERLKQVNVPAAITSISGLVVTIDPDELRKVMMMLGDLDRCIACIYFEKLEKLHQTIQ